MDANFYLFHLQLLFFLFQKLNFAAVHIRRNNGAFCSAYIKTEYHFPTVRFQFGKIPIIAVTDFIGVIKNDGERAMPRV